MKYASMLVDARRIAALIQCADSRKMAESDTFQPTRGEIRSHILWLVEHFPPEGTEHCKVVEALIEIRVFAVCAGILSIHDAKLNDYVDVNEPMPIDA